MTPAAVEIVERPLLVVHWVPRRELSEITTVVLHCTELPTLGDARRTARRSFRLLPKPSYTAGHFYVDRDGRVERWVPEDRVVNHVAGHNATSVGVELVNRGRFPQWHDSQMQDPLEEYPAVQVAATLGTLEVLALRLPAATTLVRHSDLDERLVAATDDPSRRVRRRIDPGPRFPWAEVKAHWGRRLEGRG